MDLNLTPKQLLSLSPRMLQSMEILNMTALELAAYLENLALENPVVDLEETTEKETLSNWQKKLEWLDSTDRHIAQPFQESDAKEQFLSPYGGADSFEDNLCLSLLYQLHYRKLPAGLNSVAAYVIESLDPNGYLDESDEAIAAEFQVSPSLVEQARRIVQSMDPPGVGARNLGECLALQLRRRGEDPSLALDITERCLDALGKNHLGQIAKELNVSVEEVRAAAERIRALSPKPGMGFSGGGAPPYVTPDLTVRTDGSACELLPNESTFPTLKISGFYRSLLKETEDDEVRLYLQNKIRQAAWVMQSVEKRKATLLRCAECILELQSEFFRKGPGSLRPMVLGDVAQRLDVHVSTVSRAIRGKYLQCDFGTFPLTFFFSRSLRAPESEASAASPDHAKALLKRLIREEDKRRPLSDQKLSAQMAKEGVRLSRRTVAKYRDELGFPNAFGRCAE